MPLLDHLSHKHIYGLSITVLKVTSFLIRMYECLLTSDCICNHLLPNGIQICNKFAIYLVDMSINLHIIVYMHRVDPTDLNFHPKSSVNV
jgi:hypothetical protein